MIRLAVLSYWHVHAKDYSKQAAEHPNTEIVAVWDDLPERGRAAASRCGWIRWWAREAQGARYMLSSSEAQHYTMPSSHVWFSCAQRAQENQTQ